LFSALCFLNIIFSAPTYTCVGDAGLWPAKSSPTKPHLVQGPLIVLQSPAYLCLFHRKEPASRMSLGIIGAHAGSDQAEALGASEGRAEDR
jgi:hypothetical protein